MSVALAGIGVIAIIGLAAAGSLRRHLRLARLKTDLVAAASHELRSPLASMRVLVDGLLADDPLDPKKTREYLEMLAVENQRLSRLIENFLTFSRARARPIPLRVRAVTAIGHRRRRGRGDSRARAGRRRPAGRGRARAAAGAGRRRGAVARRSFNLLDNALKYTPADKRIVVRASHDGERVSAVRRRGQRHRHSGPRAAADLPPLLSRRSASVARDQRRRSRPQHRRADRARTPRHRQRAQRARVGQHVHAARAVRRPRAESRRPHAQGTAA